MTFLGNSTSIQEMFRHTLEHFLDGSRVTQEGHGHLQTFRRDVARRRLDVVGNPLNEVRAVLVLDVQHLFVDFFSGHTATEHSSGGKVATMTRVRGAHHVLGIEGLLSEFRNSQGTVLLRTSRSQGGETNHEEVETREGDQVDSQFSQVRVQLTREAKAASDTRHGGRDQVVQVTISRGGEFESTEADIIEGFVVNNHDFIGVFDKLVDRQGSVVRLYNSVRHLG